MGDSTQSEDGRWMQAALESARAGAKQHEVPVGAVLVLDGRTVATAHNRTVRDHDPTAHAELIAIREALRALETDRLVDATLYVTLEPCAMCAGAIVLAKIGRLVYGAGDLKAGMCSSVEDLVRHPRLNHHPQVTSGVMLDECSAILTDFFHALRATGET